MKAGSGAIRDACRVLRAGGVIAYPTETVYGLGCDPRDEKAVARIFRMKGREKRKPLLLVASSFAQVRRVAIVRGPALRLAKRHWPGPLTLVLPVRRGARLARAVVRDGNVAIRVSSSPVVRAIAHRFGFPIVSTSANRSGELECRSGRAVRRLFERMRQGPDVIVDGGTLPRRKPSTVARVAQDGTVEVLRRGAVRISSRRG